MKEFKKLYQNIWDVTKAVLREKVSVVESLI